MDSRIGILLVIYNQRGGDSPSCEALRALRYPRVLVVDNSTGDFGNAAYCEQAGFAYLSMGGNQGLSKAYNRGIAYLREHTDATHVVLLDDDTTLPPTYFDTLRESIDEHPDCRIFLPLVRDEAGLLSPCAIRGLQVSRVQSPTELTQDSITGINSGMALSLDLFRDYRYNEAYFLDYIDHAFLRDMKARGEPIVVCDVTLHQRFSGNDYSNKEASKRRYELFRRDFRVFCGRSLRGRLYAAAVLGRRRLRLLMGR